MATKEIVWDSTSTDKITIDGSSFDGNQKISISSSENKNITDRAKVITISTASTPRKSITINVGQKRAVVSYQATLQSSITNFAAAGGSSVVSLQLDTYVNGNLFKTETLTPAITVPSSAAWLTLSESTISAENRGSIVGAERSAVIVGTVSDTYDGTTVSAELTISQEENSATLSYEGISLRCTYPQVSAAGGTSIPNVEYSQPVLRSYTSGYSTYLEPITTGAKLSWTQVSGSGSLNEENGEVTVSSRGTTEDTTETFAFSGAVTAVLNGRTKRVATRVTQEANIKVQTGILAKFYHRGDAFQTDPLAVSPRGGLVGIQGFNVYSFTSGETQQVEYNIPIADMRSTESATWLTRQELNGFAMGTIAARQGNVAPARSAEMWFVQGSYTSNKVAITQLESVATTLEYYTPSVTLKVSDIPASGGTISRGTLTYSQRRTQSYSNGNTEELAAITSGGSYMYSSAVRASSLGTTVTPRTQVGTLSVVVTLNGKAGSASAAVYQAANEATSITYAVPTVACSYSLLPSRGGTATPGVSYSQARTQNYTSGSTSALSAITTGATITYTKVSGDGVLNASTGVVTVASRGTTVDSANTIQCRVTVTVTLNGKSRSTTASVIQEQNHRLAVVSCWITIPTAQFSAAGGTGQCSDPWVQYSYTSGAVDEYGNNSGAQVSVSKCTLSSDQTWATIDSTGKITVQSRGTTIGEKRSFTITCTYSGVSDSSTRYQEANTFSDKSMQIRFGSSSGSSTYSAPAFASTVVAYCDVTRQYTSGSTPSGYLVAGTITSSDTGIATVSGQTVSVLSRGATVGGARSVTITAKYNSLTATGTITQAANTETQTGLTLKFANRGASGGWSASATNLSATATSYVGYAVFRVYKYTSGTSGVEKEVSGSTIPKSSATISVSWAEAYGTSGGDFFSGVKVLPQTSSDTGARSGTVKVTLDGYTSNTETFSQVALPASLSVSPTTLSLT